VGADILSEELVARVATAIGLRSEAAPTSVAPIGTGQVAVCHRLSFETEDGEIAVVAKSPSPDETSRSTARAQRLYLRETAFYRELAADVQIRTPRLLHVEHDADSDDFLIVLEDLTPARPVDQFTGLSVDDARVALDELAGLHAPTVGRTELFDRHWLRGVAIETGPMYVAILPALFEEFLKRYDDQLDAGTESVVSRLGGAIGSFAGYGAPIASVVHGDYRTDNMIFGGRGGEVDLAIVDWQTVSVSTPMMDVAYFVTTSLSPEDRVAHERELISHYLARLAGLGIEFPERTALQEYARYTLQPVVMLVAASIIVERTDRGDQMFLTMIRRAVDAVEQWDAFGELER
jgi:hypothetical protein